MFLSLSNKIKSLGRVNILVVLKDLTLSICISISLLCPIGKKRMEVN